MAGIGHAISVVVALGAPRRGTEVAQLQREVQRASAKPHPARPPQRGRRSAAVVQSAKK